MATDKALFVMKAPISPELLTSTTDTPYISVGSGEGQRGHCGFVRSEITVESGGQTGADTINGEIAARAEDEPGEHTLRIRPFRISLGLSRFGTEGSPVVSASFGWNGRTRLETREPTVPAVEPQL
jgi:hypothetical protein